MKAYLKNYRQSPRKVRLVADLIKGKPVRRALLILDTTPKRATVQLKKLVASALANAKAQNMDIESLFIQEMRVDKGLTMHRYMPKAHGRASRFDKHASHVVLTLGQTSREKSQAPGTRSETKKSIKPKAEKKPKAKKS